MTLFGVRPSALAMAFLVPAAMGLAVAASAQSTGGTVGSASAGGGVPAPIIMIVDDQKVVGQSRAFKSIQSQIEGQRQAAQKEFQSKQNDLEAAINDLQRDQRSGTLSTDQVEERRHALAKRQEEMQKDADARRQALQNNFAEALDKVKQALLEVVQGLAQERHANLVLQCARM